MSVIEEIVEKAVGPIINGISSYFNLTAYGRVKYRELLRGCMVYRNEQDYWKDAIGPYFYKPSSTKLHEGQIVKLQGFQLTEWFPRSPGLYWTQKGYIARQMAQKEIEEIRDRILVFTPTGKSYMRAGGIGTTRVLEHQTGGSTYKILCATSSGNCNAGIPVVMPKDVYHRIEDPLLTQTSLEVDVEGVYSTIPFRYEDFILPAISADLQNTLKQWLAVALHVPKNCVLVESPLLIKRYISDFSLEAAGWTAYETKDKNFSFTYATFNPRDEDSIIEATDFIKEYVKGHNGFHLLTDFDERIPRFDSLFPLKDVLENKVNPNDVELLKEELSAWARSIKEVS